MDDKEIINRVEQSDLLQIDIEDFYPAGERVLFDMKDVLFQELVLREKDFRAFVKKNDWTQYQDQFVGVYCSNDAVVPMWAYMLVSSELMPYAKKVVFGDKEDVEKAIYTDVFNDLNSDDYQDKKIIIKGCGRKNLPQSIYIDFFNRLQPHAKSIMFGEACSAVPIFKKKKA